MPNPTRKVLDHNNLINFRIKQKQDPQKFRDQFLVIFETLRVAEQNFNVIISTAGRIAKVFANLRRYTTFDINAVLNVVDDMRIVFGLIRLRIIRDFNIFPQKGEHVAAADQQLPERIRQNSHRCLCPLAALLQAIAKCFSDLKVNIRSDTKNNLWGTIEPLHKVLENMEAGFSQRQDGEHSGLAQCIMIHERNSRYLVTSTAPRYRAVEGLRLYTADLRRSHLNGMKAVLPEQSLARVIALERYSAEVEGEFSAAKKQGTNWTKQTSSAKAEVESILGCNGSFSTRGRYMTACLLDHLRFQIGRSTAAQEDERRKTEGRDVHSTISCAEWELYITLLHNPDPERRDTPHVVAVSYGMPKAKTWETSKSNTRPPVATSAPPRPSPLPAYPKPT